MSRLFAVIRSRGPAWDRSRTMENQHDWRRHADFMNHLAATGFLVLVGPLEGSDDVLAIVRSSDAAAVRSRLADDCWSWSELLQTTRIAPWSLRIGSLD